jgi:hypothetical protein
MGPGAVLGDVVTTWRIMMAGAKFRGAVTKILMLAIVMIAAGVGAVAQIDLSGTWSPRNYSDSLGTQPGPGPGPVDFLGIPFSEYALVRALSFSSSQMSMPDRVCVPYSPPYLMMGPFGLKIWNETEPHNGTTLNWNLGGWEDLAQITIWMDGRGHPSKNAPHEIGGFTTGAWEDDVLTAYTTHMKAGLLRRSGAPHSDQATMTTRFFRHGDLLTVSARVDDPTYLTEPYYMIRTFQLSSVAPSKSVGQPCIPGNEGVPEGVVPHYLPGKNPFLQELTRLYNIPAEAALGGAETMYPEYRKKLKDRYSIPPPCQRACGGPGQYPLRTN